MTSKKKPRALYALSPAESGHVIGLTKAAMALVQAGKQTESERDSFLHAIMSREELKAPNGIEFDFSQMAFFKK